MSVVNLTPPQLEIVDMLRFAFKNGASDVHFEPLEHDLQVRMRVNGKLEFLKIVDSKRRISVEENIKALLSFDMSKYGIPQDSRYRHPTEPVDFRANLVPTLYGEKVCLRLLERGKKFHLNHYPLELETKRLLFRIIQKGQGLIIVSGPTGSGKSTLLYSILGSIDRDTKAVYTIEDPVEYALDGLIQIPVSKKLGFGSALRALMRQDPDVMMVGEIRDEETAEAAIHAASTGHLVLSTIHSNDSDEVFSRLEGLGVPRAIAEPVTLFSSAQRLAIKLCEHCREDDHESKALVSHLFEDVIDFIPQKASGCERCRGKGDSGRMLLFEYMTPQKTNGHRQLTRFGSLRNQAYLALEQGDISAKEAYRCFGD